MKSKSNKMMMIYAAINIMCIVDAHAWSSLGFVKHYMPYNMFIIPAFIFNSGYFFVYKEEMKLLDFTKRKIQKLLLPYYIWWFIYAAFVFFLNLACGIKIGWDVNLRSLFLGPWISGECWSFNNPSWFVCTLFCVQLAYFIIRKALAKVWNDFGFLLILTFLSISTTYYVMFYPVNEYLTSAFRTLILMWFFQFAIIFRAYMEEKFKKCSGMILCALCLLITAVLGQIFHGVTFGFNVLGWNGNGMDGKENFAGIYLLLVGVLGILFWLKISQVLVPAVENSKILNFISNHTFEIMINHVLFMWLVNLILFAMSENFEFMNFNTWEAIHNPWYRWTDTNWCEYVYFAAGMLGAILVSYLSDQVKARISWEKGNGK